MPQVTTLKGLCNEIYQTSIVGNINITAQNIKRSYKYHIRYKSRHEWTHLKTEILNGLELRSRFVFDLSSLCLELSLDSSIYPFNHPCICICHYSFIPSYHSEHSLYW